MQSNLPQIAAVIPAPEGVQVGWSVMTFASELAWGQYEGMWHALNDLDMLSAQHVPLWLGDLLNEVEVRYGETYASLIDLVPVERVETLRQYKWVCGQVPPGMRVRLYTRVHDSTGAPPPLTYTHYRMVAGLESPARREIALSLAAEHDWSTRELRDFIRGWDVPQGADSQGGQSDTPTLPDVAVLPADDVDDDRWQRVENLLDVAWEALGQRNIEDAALALDSAIELVREATRLRTIQ